MQSMPILTIESAERLLDALDDLLEMSEANYALVIDRGGAIFSEHGNVPKSIDTTVIAALAAGSFAATRELALRIGEAEFFALYQQGENAQILMCAVDDDSVLVTVFGPQTTLGLVRFYSARAVKRIASVLHDCRSNQRVAPVFFESDVRGAQNLFGA